MSSGGRSARLAVLAIPSLAAFAIVGGYLMVESVRPGMLTAPRPRTIPEAVVVGNGPLALEMIADGLDVNAHAVVRRGMFDTAEYELTPLEAALLSQRIEIVRLLVRTGADVSRSRNAACLATARLPEALPLLGLSAAPVAGDYSACFKGSHGANAPGTATGRPSPAKFDIELKA